MSRSISCSALVAIALTPIPAPQATGSSHAMVIMEVESDAPATPDTQFEWIELYNRSTGSVPLSGWTLSDNTVTIALPDVTLPGHEPLVIRNDPGSLGACVQHQPSSGLALANGGDRLILRESSGTVVDAMSYGSDITQLSPAPSAPAADTADTLARDPSGSDTDSSVDWTTGAPTPCVPMNRPPVLDQIGDLAVSEGQTLALTLSAADPDTDPITFAVAGAPSGALLDAGTGAFSWTPSHDQAGTHPVTFSASDGKGGVDQESVTLSVSDMPVGIAAEISLEASRRTVDPGHRIRFRALARPCPTYAAAPIRLLRGSVPLAERETDPSCAARFRVRVRRTATYRAMVPAVDGDRVGGTSARLRVRVR